MEIVIESYKQSREFEFADKVARFVLESGPSQSLSIANLLAKEMWVQVDGDGILKLEELREVITFDLNPFPSDHAMRVLTQSFEGSSVVLFVPAMPGFRWMIP